MNTARQTLVCLLLGFSALVSPRAWTQLAPPAAAPPPPRPALPPLGQPPGRDLPELTRFNLDFAGGSPAELVTAIQKATGRPLNVIIPEHLGTDVHVPALKLNQVDVAELFRALESASHRTELRESRGFGNAFSYSYVNSSYGFKTDGPLTDDSVWYLHVENPPRTPESGAPPPPPNVCRFYSLAPYLERGLKVEDITTAIETGWKMLGLRPDPPGTGDLVKPQMSFHQDTKLLIAVGEERKLQTIDVVLKALEPSTKPPAPPAEKPAEKTKPGGQF